MYNADYTGCYMNPYNSTVAFHLQDQATRNNIVNINGVAAISSDVNAFVNAYYTFETQGAPCG